MQIGQKGLERAVDLGTRVYFERGRHIERALRIAMAYYGLAEWRPADRRRLEIVERDRDGADALLSDRVTLEVRVDRVTVWTMIVEWRGLVFTFGHDTWSGRLAGLNA